MQQKLADKESIINQLSFQLKLRSETTESKSKKGVNYKRLEQILAQEKWTEADKETADRMLEVIGKDSWSDVRREDIEQFPCDDLRSIDRLWVYYSNGHFGFSIQKKIWLEVGGKIDYDTECKLGVRLGWHNGQDWMSYNSLICSLSQAPDGHFPSWRSRPGLGGGEDRNKLRWAGCCLIAQRIETCDILF